MRKRALAVAAALIVLSTTGHAPPDYTRLEVVVYMPLVLNGWQLNVGGEDLAMSSNFKVIEPEETVNYILNPSAEAAGNFSAIGGATVTRVTTYQKHNLYSYRVQTSADNTGASFVSGALPNAVAYATVKVRGTLPASWDWSLDNTNWHTPTLIMPLDANWSIYGYAFPSGEANGSTSFLVQQKGAGAGDFYLDGLQVESKDHWTTFCGYGEEGCESVGTPHASRSQRSANSRAGGRLRDLSDYGLIVTGASGLGLSPVDVRIDAYSGRPGGALNSIHESSAALSIAVLLRGSSLPNLHSNAQALEALLSEYAVPSIDGRTQPIRLWYTGSAVVKEIEVHYDGGLEGALAADTPCNWWRASIHLTAPDPFWKEVGNSAAVLDTIDSATFQTVAARLRSTGQWSNLGPPTGGGPYTAVYAIAEDAQYVYYGGNFQDFNGIANADYFVRYNKETGAWSAPAVGANGIIYALAKLPDGRIVAGGAFTSIGGVAASRIAVYDPTTGTWEAMGVGVDNNVYALTVGKNGLLYLGGAFLNAGGGATNRIASWDPSTGAYAALGVGVNNVVRALATGIDGQIFAGGDFTTAGGSSALRVASWYPSISTWSPLDTGVDNVVRALAVSSDGILYIGGDQIYAGTLLVNRICSWDGVAMSALGSGTDNSVRAIAVSPDGSVLLTGSFAVAGGITIMALVAGWNGSTFFHTDLGTSWTDGLVIFTSAVVGNKYNLWVGGGGGAGLPGGYGGSITISYTGTAPAFPHMVASRSGGTGATIAMLRNEMPPLAVLYDYNLQDGETLTTDFSPDEQSVESSFFGSRPDAVLRGSDWQFTINPGSNQITSYVIVTGGATATAYMTWRTAYLSAD